MSAPNTDLEKQRRRHRGPLIGMTCVVVFGVVLLVVWLLREAADAPGQPSNGTGLDPSQGPSKPMIARGAQTPVGTTSP